MANNSLNIFLTFPIYKDLTLHMNCLLRTHFICTVKSYFLVRIKIYHSFFICEFTFSKQLNLKMPSKIVVDSLYFIIIFQQKVHMKYQASFSLKNKKSYFKTSSAAVVAGILRVKTTCMLLQQFIVNTDL